MGVGSWFQQGPGNSSAQLGSVSDQTLAFTDVSAVTAGAASGALIAADTTGIGRTVIISIKSTADTGIHVSFGGVATTSMLFLGPGIYSFVTTQAIACIRAGAADVTVYVATAKV